MASVYEKADKRYLHYNDARGKWPAAFVEMREKLQEIAFCVSRE